eukprot:TRINITY_DN244_c0_g1_i1.p1 TRINITY_DN244_c0_g1~~TRINITY_DN244_c0_g1_i1.p1  ORF type:complete len:172 (-),score=54.74 TRINITY_DN244_c0_g1_i1:87-602(-)
MAEELLKQMSGEEDCEKCDILEGIDKARLELKKNTTKRKKRIKKRTIDKTNNHNKTAVANKEEGPPGLNLLGRSTWTFLHSVAAFYPNNPSDEEKQNVNELIVSVSKNFPCTFCANDFKKYIKKHPPSVTNRDEFSIWMCEAHNDVNRKLGKKEFSCDIENIQNRWGRYDI